MANDLLDLNREDPEEERETAPGLPENPERVETAGFPSPEGMWEEEPAPEGPAPEEPKSVFAPSIWDRRAAKNADQEARKEERQARKAQQESDRRQQFADRETKKLELQLAREERKTREEERRQEQKRLEEERRQERKARAEEDRQVRREERAGRKTVRRVGTMTLGLSLIAIGAAILMYMVYPGFDLRIVARLAPIILIGLGVETLIRYFFSKDRTYMFDFASGIICIFLVIGSFFIALIPELMYYISPQRYTAEAQLLQTERDKVYEALKGEQRVASYNVYGGVQTSLPSARKDENGNWVYELNYLHTDIYLLDPYESEEAFARVCQELMGRLNQVGVFQKTFNLYFSAPENDEGVRYSLSLNNRLQMEMNAESLTKLVEPIYSRPTTENGWRPGGYEDIADQYGLIYADHFTYLVENYSEDSANIYFSLLMNDGRPDWAENYFRTVTGEDDGFLDGSEEGNSPVPVPDEDGEENASIPAREVVPNGESETPPAPNAPVPAEEVPPAAA